MPTDPLDLAYLAGIFDGEGWLGPQGEQRTYCRWHLGIGNTDVALIDWLKSFGGNTHLRKPVPNRSPFTTWTLSRRREQILFLETLLPYLRLKKQRAEEALAVLREHERKQQVRAAGGTE